MIIVVVVEEVVELVVDEVVVLVEEVVELVVDEVVVEEVVIGVCTTALNTTFADAV